MKFNEQVQFLKKLTKLADEAAKHDIALGNGGDVSSLLGSMATDLENTWQVSDQIHQNLKKIVDGNALFYCVHGGCSKYGRNVKRPNTSPQYCDECKYILVFRKAVQS